MYRIVTVGGTRVFHYDRLVKLLDESNINQDRFRADNELWQKEYPQYFDSQAAMINCAFHKHPFSMTWQASLLWWLVRNMPVKRWQKTAASIAIWLEPFLTRYPVGVKLTKRQKEADKLMGASQIYREIAAGTYKIEDIQSAVVFLEELFSDGWLGKEGKLLFQGVFLNEITIHFELPDWLQLEMVTVRLNYAEKECLTDIQRGHGQIKTDLDENKSLHLLSLSCSPLSKLPGADTRWVGVRLESITIVSNRKEREQRAHY